MTYTLIYYIMKGFTFAEAAALSTPNVGWMNLNEGDPINAPLAPRNPIVDVSAPTLLAGFPSVSLKSGSTSDWLMRIAVSDSPEPEVVKAQVAFGLTTSYGSIVNSSRGYWRRLSLTLPNLTPNSLYHFQLTLTDAVGNVTKTGDLTFPTGKIPTAAQCSAVRGELIF